MQLIHHNDLLCRTLHSVDTEPRAKLTNMTLITLCFLPIITQTLTHPLTL